MIQFLYIFGFPNNLNWKKIEVKKEFVVVEIKIISILNDSFTIIPISIHRFDKEKKYLGSAQTSFQTLSRK